MISFCTAGDTFPWSVMIESERLKVPGDEWGVVFLSLEAWAVSNGLLLKSMGELLFGNLVLMIGTELSIGMGLETLVLIVPVSESESKTSGGEKLSL